MNAMHYPFDKQECSLRFGSWAFDNTKLDITLDVPYVDKEDYSESEEWGFVDSKAERQVRKYNCCPEPYSTVVFTLVIQRRALFFLLNVVVPCGLITFSSLLSFVLPPNSGERVSFLMTVLVAFSVYMMIFTEEMPHSSNVPLASKFFLFLMVQQGLSLMATCFIIRFHNNNSPIPKWFDVLVNKWLAFLMFMQPGRNFIGPGRDDLFIKNTQFPNKDAQNEEHGLCRERTRKKSSEISAPKSDKDTGNWQEEPEAKVMMQEDLGKFFAEVKVPADYYREIKAKDQLQDDWIFATRVLDRFFLALLTASFLISLVLIFFQMKHE